MIIGTVVLCTSVLGGIWYLGGMLICSGVHGRNYRRPEHLGLWRHHRKNKHYRVVWCDTLGGFALLICSAIAMSLILWEGYTPLINPHHYKFWPAGTVWFFVIPIGAIGSFIVAYTKGIEDFRKLFETREMWWDREREREKRESPDCPPAWDKEYEDLIEYSGCSEFTAKMIIEKLEREYDALAAEAEKWEQPWTEQERELLHIYKDEGGSRMPRVIRQPLDYEQFPDRHFPRRSS